MSQQERSTFSAPRRFENAFTLVELLVVLALLALLLTLSLPRYLNTTETAKEQVRQRNLATLRDSLDKFRADQGRFPGELVELVQKGYLRAIPLDPVSGSAQWTTIPHPTQLESGIYDVASPAHADMERAAAPPSEGSSQ